MFELIEKIRRKSDRQKKLLAFFVALSFSSIIFCFWVLTVIPQTKEQNNLDKKIKALEKSPTSSLASVINSGGSLLTDQVNNIKSAIKLLNLNMTSPPSYFKGTSTTELKMNFLDETANN